MGDLMPDKMTVRRALKSYGINLPPPKPKVDPGEVKRQAELKEKRRRESLFQDLWQKTMRGE